MGAYDEAMLAWILQLVREHYMLTGSWPTVAQLLAALSQA